MAEIVKLKELPNDGLETSWGALWLGIRTGGNSLISADVQTGGQAAGRRASP